MNSAIDTVHRMKPHHLANPALGDRAALNRVRDANGYWFFRDVLDRGSILEAKAALVRALIAAGFVDEGSQEPVWNGKDLGDFQAEIKQHLSKDIWRRIVDHPVNKAFFEAVLDGPVQWLPMDYFRLKVPNTSGPSADPQDGRHQDGYGSHGLPFVTCWIPLMEIDHTVGGLAVVEKYHTHGILHSSDTPPYIAGGVIPEENWRYTAYLPGDVVIFTPPTPHSGLDNFSNQFRLSVDLRVLPLSEQQPVIGKIKQIDEAVVTIATDNGDDVSLMFNDKSHCMVRGAVPMTQAEAIATLSPGRAVMALEHDGNVVVLRPQTEFENAG